MGARFHKLLLTASLAGLLAACGGLGESDTESCAICGPQEDIYGSIASQASGQAAMAGWVVVAVERDTNIARVGEVNSAGLYTLRQLKTNATHTLILLSPDYIVQAVLSIPGSVPNTIRQFFKVTSTNLPKLIFQGPVIKFENLSGISITRDMAADDDGDGIPNGAPSMMPLNLLQAARDTDLDGTRNEYDPDLDGDGIPNIIDPDDDGDGVIDVIDGDANDNLVIDENEANGDQYFPEGVEYIAVQWEKKPKSDGSGTDTSLYFKTKVRSNVTPKSVQIRGAPTVLNAAQVETVDEAGNPAFANWNRLLEDNGLTSDDGPNDRIFAAKVKLADGQAPRAHEMVFFQLRFGSDANPWFMEFPYTFPNLTPGDISAQYEPNSNTVLLVTEAGKRPPFGELQDYRWSVVVKDADGKIIHTSEPLLGSTKSYQIPSNRLLSGRTYTFSVVAQVLPKVAGVPAYSIHSQEYTIDVP